ncbi:conjugal transfer protein [Mesorhizobium sp. M1C.F.Ca.ET.193.01.1.1]|uniref:type IV secretion system protein n=1 Tax=unclassified Mesorhizobium TaxID=325217 RepID=UPI000FD2C440|nr:MULTISPECIES: type IV secretion system protein [unclassified Mesorhizobium]TGS94402.1 conjugal transfer protein [bacterium M00.F.Ca.ET.177.01.1.1]TGQ51593.1 conjugal transfer protein [Mesorhizobium sp. M1C.F.Ca.ET.210.01.1.1]TGQ67821.1 conjugal transfer protein [Mesorhizobium sp. M1C.F.Ca.ET.212.01.1.1]TGR02415.1 conjugal transfer protein [Mesorhizobium sp. M1C.F.Ca.ET.204.01.1.1]TGR22956.1 conjugal transfer protein [Mesorhizobium sp. M1C.F.Ca.ET.196.01.1.1]
MKRSILTACSVLFASAAWASGVPVIDGANLKVAKETAMTTDKILNTNKDILSTVEDTLKAVTGDRGGDANQMQNLAVGNGFSVSSMPSFDSIMSGGVPNFGGMGGDISKIATTFINGLQLVKSLSGKSNSGFSSDKSYEELMNTVLGVSALVTGSQKAVTARRSALEQAGQSIGQAQDIKGSIDQNTQLQVQAGLTINELIGVMNGAVGSLQADNQRRLTDISNSKKALTYGGN